MKSQLEKSENQENLLEFGKCVTVKKWVELEKWVRFKKLCHI